MFYPDVQMQTGKIISGKQIQELVEIIMSKFAEENLCCYAGKIILQYATEAIEEYSKVKMPEEHKELSKPMMIEECNCCDEENCRTTNIFLRSKQRTRRRGE